MVDYNVVQKQIQELRPKHIECKEGTLCVAIVPHDRTLTQHHAAGDLMWVKCPKSKQIQVLIDAYRSKFRPQAQNLHLYHCGQRLDPKSLADLIQDGDKVVVLHATTRIPPVDTPVDYPTPRRTSSAHSMQHKPKTPVMQPPSTPFDPLKSPTDPPSTPFVASQPPNKYYASSEFAWIDFVFARRAFRLRRYGHTGDDPEGTNIMTQQWFAISDQQRKELESRAIRIATDSIPRRRAFWQYYAENLDDSVTNLDATYMSPDIFTDAVTGWHELPSGGRQVYANIAKRNNDSEPPPPPDKAVLSAPPPIQVDDSTEDEDGDEDRQHEPDIDHAEQFAEALQNSDGNTQAVTTRFNINDLFSEASTALYEQGVKKGLDVLSSLRKILDTAPGSPDADQWLTMVNKVELQAQNTRTIIGVVGATGAGKSSVINAMLDEERLLPTNCMRACTAVVTEISYNSKNDSYRAEIEFISQAEWRKELTILFQELLDSHGNVSREAVLNEDSEAGIAYAKLRAVYPHLTKDTMSTATPDRLIEHKNANVLGTVKDLESENASDFYQSLQRYVDSKEKVRKPGPGKPPNETKGAQTVEYWPLIKVVRLYVKAPALETGAVIVDLPGVHDSNQARAAVAQRYMKECTGLWIVAPINRAVDDKSAKTLLGETFKRQLKIDGAYNSVTFICSKTDDISLTEAIDSLQLDEKLQAAYDKIQELTEARKEVQQQLHQQRESLEDIANAIEKADDELETWESVLSKLQSGEPAYPPAEKKEKKMNAKKRKKAPASKPRKKSKYSEDSDDDFVLSNGSVESDMDDFLTDNDEEEEEEEETREPVTEDEALAKVEELRNTKKEGRRTRIEIENVIKDLRKQVQANKQEQETSDAIISHECISGRNTYSRTAIKQDFAAGIKELDQEIAEEEDAANFNPDEDMRDYDEVAESLPVFCVSSRGYQKLMGRMKKDKHVLGFETVEQTEIPALQQHCSKLTESNREAACKRFLNSLSALLNSIRLWASSDGTSANLTDEQLKREKKILEDKLGKLDSALEKQVRSTQTNIKDELEENLYGVFAAAVEAAKNQANATVAKWARPYNRNELSESGLHYSTYKAVCRRDGVYTNAYLGLLHFNEQLTEPIIKYIANGWEKTFQRRIPGILTTLVTVIDKMLHTFHSEVEKRAIKNGSSMARFHMLKDGLANYREVVKDTTNRTKLDISSKQRDINREFVPVVTNAMLPAYETCTNEKGIGSYKRMKAAMEQHVDWNRSEMFANATDTVRKLIAAMLKDVQAELEASMDEIFLSMKRDYTQLVTGISTANEEHLTRDQRKMRKEALDVVEGARLRFERVVGLASPSPAPTPGPDETQPGDPKSENEVSDSKDANVDESEFNFDKELEKFAKDGFDENSRPNGNDPDKDVKEHPEENVPMLQDTTNTFDQGIIMSSVSPPEVTNQNNDQGIIMSSASPPELNSQGNEHNQNNGYIQNNDYEQNNANNKSNLTNYSGPIQYHANQQYQPQPLTANSYYSNHYYPNNSSYPPPVYNGHPPHSPPFHSANGFNGPEVSKPTSFQRQGSGYYEQKENQSPHNWYNGTYQ